MAILFLLGGDPVWVIAAANFTYLIGIACPAWPCGCSGGTSPSGSAPTGLRGARSCSAWSRPWVWLLTTVLGFQQFGLPTVLFGLGLAYSGSALYAWRPGATTGGGKPRLRRSLHVKLTGAMVPVLVLDGAGYLIAVATAAGRPGAGRRSSRTSSWRWPWSRSPSAWCCRE